MHNPVCTIVIAGPKNVILIMGDHLIVLVGAGKSGLKIIGIKQMLNKSRALLQLEANDEDAQSDQAQASRKTSPSGKVHVHDVSFWSPVELTEVGRLVSLTTKPGTENEQLGINTSILSLSFDKKTIFKVSQFDFDSQQKRYNARLEILYALSHGQPLCIYDAPEGLLVSMHNQGIRCIHGGSDSCELTNAVERNPSVILDITKTKEKLVFLTLMTIR